MAYCLNPSCIRPQNADSNRFCVSCRSLLWLKERYLASTLLGLGGFGRTFLGRDRYLPSSPPCVIKQLYLQQGDPAIQQKAIALFEQEALHLQNLGGHPQIPTLFAYFEQDGQLYLVQEYIEGETLEPSMWQRGGDLEAKIWQLLRDLLPVLQFLSDRNVIHRDIKPANIIQRCDGKFILIDFGVSRLLTNTALMGGATIVGTPGFMAPEQMYGQVLPASDLYSLGVTCVNLLTGLKPERLYDALNERWVWREHLPSGTQISPRLGKLLNNLLHPSLRQRSSSAAAVLQDMGVNVSPIESTPSDLTAIQSPRVSNPSPSTEVTVAQVSQPQHNVGEQVRIDYTRLKRLLSHRKWKEADEETHAILCQLVGKPVCGYLDSTDIEKLPCLDLNAIDYLWSKSSKGKFGFKVQAKIYHEVGEEYHLFCERVGWMVYQPSTEGKSLIFSGRAPVGHLPSRRWVGGGYNPWKHAGSMAERLLQCRQGY